MLNGIKKMNDLISVVVPVFNEERAVASTIKHLKEVMDKSGYDYEVIAVNDGSKDRSQEILNKINGIKVINHPYNLGYSASLKDGIKHAKGNYILITDADGTYPIKEIPNLLEHIDKYDMVVGERRKENVPLLRRPAKSIISKLANFVSGKKIPDINCGLRIFKKDIALKFWNLFPSGFSFTITITLACLTNEYTVKYVPISYFKRKGKSTIHPIKDFVNFINLIARIVTYFNPFKVFFSVSILLFLIGLLVFLYTKFYIGLVADITVIVILLSSLQIFLIGLVADLIAKKR